MSVICEFFDKCDNSICEHIHTHTTNDICCNGRCTITDKDVRCRPYDKLMRKKKLEKINERRR
jgi:hypothetical protein